MKLKEVTQGIVHPQNTVSKKNIELVERLTLNEGVFVINEVEKKELGLNKKENSIVKPTYTTKELKRYFKLEKPRFWTIYTDKTFNDEIKIKDYPNIKKHIDKFSKINTSSNKPYGLHRPRNEYFFKKGDKILVARKSIIPTFTYLEDECYPTFTFNVIKSQRISLKYLTILLNSDLITFWLKHRGKMQGTHFQIDIEPLLRIPIVNNTEKTNILEEKLNLLLKEKKLNKKIIEECNLIIYLIYGLSNTEIDIIKKDIRGKS
jgi:adenine-specific DNA-methyltransferase